TRTAATRTIRLYVNGVFKGSRTYARAVAAGPRQISLGRTEDGSKYVNGRIDEVAIYRSVLSASQAAAHYAARTSVGAVVALPLVATDSDGDPLTFAATGLPPS